MRRLALSLATLALAGCGSARAIVVPPRTTVPPTTTTTTVVTHDPISTNGVTLTGTARCDGNYWTVTWQASSPHPGSFVSWAGADGVNEDALGAVVSNWDANLTATFRYPLANRIAYELIAVNWYETEGGQTQKWAHQGSANATVIQPRCVPG